MRFFFFSFLFSAFLMACTSETNTKKTSTNTITDDMTVLARQMDSIGMLDQKYRMFMSETDPKILDSLSKIYNIDYKKGGLQALQIAQDNKNMAFVEQVIAKHGYPGSDKVGNKKNASGVHTNEVAWFVIQHNGKISKYVDAVKKSSEKGGIHPTKAAFFEDAALMQQHQPQIYGTQGFCQTKENSNKEECFIWPVQDAKTVNERRLKVGFKESIEQYSMMLNGVKYREVGMNEVEGVKF